MKQCEVCGSTKGRIYGKNGKYKMDLCGMHRSQMFKEGQIRTRTKFDANEFVINEDHYRGEFAYNNGKSI